MNPKIKLLAAALTLNFGLQTLNSEAQNIGINATGATPNVSAALDVDMNDKGLLIPRVALTSTADVVTIPTPATSLLVYNNNAAMTGGGLGFYYWNSTNWVSLTPAPVADDWKLLGNAGTVDGTNFIGTTDNVPFNIRVNNQKAGRIQTNGPTFFGYQAGNADARLTNTAFGYQALLSNVTKDWNTAFGYQALMSLGALGSGASTAFGYRSLSTYTGGGLGPNTAFGFRTLEVSTGGWNVAMGNFALGTNTTGNSNTAVGAGAVNQNTTGNDNTGIGSNALNNISLGSSNTALGSFANITVANLSNATMLGAGATSNASNRVRVGNTSVTNIQGQVGWTIASDARFKTNVTEEVHGLDFITKLRPVVYNFDTRKLQEFLTQNMPDSTKINYFKGIDFEPSTAIRQTGFIAQEVEQILKEINYDFNGLQKPANEIDNYGITYASFVVPLVKSVQELNTKAEEQQQVMEELKKIIEAQQQMMQEMKKQIELLKKQSHE